jgi:hypothetical protein
VREGVKAILVKVERVMKPQSSHFLDNHTGCFSPPPRILVLIFFQGLVDPRVTLRLEGFGKLGNKNV